MSDQEIIQDSGANKASVSSIHKKLASLIGLSVVFLVLASGGTLLFVRHLKHSNQSKLTNTNISPPTFNIEKLPPDQQADALANTGHYAAAQALLMQQLRKATTPSQKVYIRMHRTALALNMNNLSDAKNYALQAETADKTAESADLLGYVAEKSGNKTTAKTQYQLALYRLSKGDKNSLENSSKTQEYQDDLKRVSQ